MIPANSQLRTAALLALIVHLIAGTSMALILSRGLATTSDLIARLGFLVTHRAQWTIAWLTWQAAALCILWFYYVFASTASEPILRLAVLLAAAAIGPDLAGQIIEIAVLPEIAGRALTSRADRDTFFLLDRIAVMLSGYAANGLYSLAAVLFAWFTRRRYSRAVWLAGLAAGVSGLALSLATLIDSVCGMFWTNVFLLPLLVIWLGGVAHSHNER
jgi:hypothetical protein